MIKVYISAANSECHYTYPNQFLIFGFDIVCITSKIWLFDAKLSWNGDKLFYHSFKKMSCTIHCKMCRSTIYKWFMMKFIKNMKIFFLCHFGANSLAWLCILCLCKKYLIYHKIYHATIHNPATSSTMPSFFFPKWCLDNTYYVPNWKICSKVI